jgi:hypothetical protein
MRMVRPHCNCDEIAVVNKLNENNIERWTLEVRNSSSSRASRRIILPVAPLQRVCSLELERCSQGGSSPRSSLGLQCRSKKSPILHWPIVRSGNLCKPRGPCVLPAVVVSLLISSFKLLAHASSLVSWGFWLFVPYSSVIPCHGGLQPPFTTRWLFAPVLSGSAMPIQEITNPSLPIVRSGNLCKPRGPCVLPAAVVSLLISSFKLLAHASSLVSWGILALRTLF